MEKPGENYIGEVRLSLSSRYLNAVSPRQYSGICVSPREEIIRGSLKYSWKEGRSIARASDPIAKSEPVISSVPKRLN